jgi:hypothetical protein
MQSVHESLVPHDTNTDRPSGEYPSSPLCAEAFTPHHADFDVLPATWNDDTQYGIDAQALMYSVTEDEITLLAYAPGMLPESPLEDRNRTIESIVFQRSEEDMDGQWLDIVETARWFYHQRGTKKEFDWNEVRVAQLHLRLGDHPLDIMKSLIQSHICVTDAACIVLFAKGGVA